MTKQNSTEGKRRVSRDHLAELLNEDLSREYQAIIAYVVYSQVQHRRTSANLPWRSDSADPGGEQDHQIDLATALGGKLLMLAVSPAQPQ
jgi:hypothetical protein